MPEEVLFKTEDVQSRVVIANILADAADQIEGGSMELSDGDKTESVTIPEEPTLEVELERITNSESGDGYYELEYEISWSV